jgi:hypothetical protein
MLGFVADYSHPDISESRLRHTFRVFHNRCIYIYIYCRDNFAQISTELHCLLSAESFPSMVESSALSPAAAATASVLAESAEDVIACLAEWHDTIREIGMHCI